MSFLLPDFEISDKNRLSRHRTAKKSSLIFLKSSRGKVVYWARDEACATALPLPLNSCIGPLKCALRQKRSYHSDDYLNCGPRKYLPTSLQMRENHNWLAILFHETQNAEICDYGWALFIFPISGSYPLVNRCKIIKFMHTPDSHEYIYIYIYIYIHMHTPDFSIAI